MAAEDDLIRRLAEQLGISGAAAEDLAKSLKDATSASSKMASASGVETGARNASSESYKKTIAATKAWGQQAGSATSGLISLAGSVSGTTAAFTSLIPILDSMQSVMKLSIEAMGGITSGLLSLLGRTPMTLMFSALGKAVTAGVQATVLKALELTFTAAKLLLSETQKLANSYATLAQSGMIFGGSLENAKAAATEAGVSLQTFSTFASKSAEALALIGGNSETSAKRIMKMATSMDKAMIGMYGGFDNMAASLADYVVMQTKSGYDAVKNQSQLEAGAKSYLMAEKELQILTGKKADALRQEQQRRLDSSAFQMKLQTLTIAQQQQMQNLLSQVKQKYGDRAESILMEKFTNEDGVMMNPDNLKLIGQIPAFGTLADDLLSTQELGTKESAAAQAAIFEKYAPIFQEAAKQNQYLMQIQASRPGMNPILDEMNKAFATTTGTYSQQANAIQAQLDASKSVGEAFTKTTSIIGDATVKLEAMTAAIEKVVIKNFDKLGTVIDLTYDSFMLLIEGLEMITKDDTIKTLSDRLTGMLTAPPLGPQPGEIPPPTDRRNPFTGVPTDPLANEKRQYEEREERRRNTPVKPTPVPVVGTSTFGGDAAEQAAHQKKLVEIYQSAGEWGTLGNYLKDLVTKTRQERYDEANKPKKADGGIVNSPSIAGEAGPEAVIPLKNGSIPLDLNLGEMIAVLREQTELSRDLVDHMRDSKDIQQKILYATV